jgi:hypothetical protein
MSNIRNTKNTKINKKIKKYNETYPMSANGQQCIGPCYFKNTKIIHPISLDEWTSNSKDFCPVHTFIRIDPVTKRQDVGDIDECTNPTIGELQLDEYLQENSLLPQLNFSSDYFTKIYYKIMCLEDMLKWLEQHRSDPFKTKERVFNTSMVVYGDQLNILDNRIILFVNDLMIAYLPKLYRRLKQYIIISDNTVKLDNSNNNENDEDAENDDADNDDDGDETDNIEDNEKDNTNKNIKIIVAYIKDKFLGSDNIYQFMSKIIRYYKEDMTNRYISDILVNHMIEYIIKRIKVTLEQ